MQFTQFLKVGSTYIVTNYKGLIALAHCLLHNWIFLASLLILLSTNVINTSIYYQIYYQATDPNQWPLVPSFFQLPISFLLLFSCYQDKSMKLIRCSKKITYLLLVYQYWPHYLLREFVVHPGLNLVNVVVRPFLFTKLSLFIK